MRPARPLVLSVAALAIAGAAYAERPTEHVAAYQLPDGSVAQVRYTGDVAPRMVLVGDPMAAMAGSPVAAFDRIAAMMDAQADAMFGEIAGMTQAAASSPADGGIALSPATLAAAPAGVQWTSVSQTTSGGKVCTTEVSMVSQGDGKAPTMRRTVSGDCGGGSATPAPAAAAKPATVPPDSI